MTNIQDIPSLLSCAKKFADLQVIQTQLPGERTVQGIHNRGSDNADFCGADCSVFSKYGDSGSTVSAA
jgi:hypothetical protein